MITIIDYGLGNVLAFQNVYKRLDIPSRIARSAEELDGATRLILPGVGAFDRAMALFDGSGMRPRVEALVHEKGIPVLGICVGMQMLADSSEEGERPGLGWISGTVRLLRPASPDVPMRLPHMGWNDVIARSDCSLFDELRDYARFYFLHSFHFVPATADTVAATCNYGIEIVCAVQSRCIWGVQFHPEKSHHFGSRLLENFARRH
jgi:imidazole glycerol-phosphate synthase subunit HisH